MYSKIAIRPPAIPMSQGKLLGKKRKMDAIDDVCVGASPTFF